MKTSWAVTVVYDGEAKRAEAAKFCDQLVQRFWAGAELDLNWWSFEQMHHPKATAEAAAKAAAADLVVLAMSPGKTIPMEVDYWLEHWASRRGEHEGVLVGLLGAEPTAEAAEKHQRLRKIARQAGLDYLTGLPEYVAHRIPDSCEPYHDRAHHKSSLMDEILQHPPAPHLTS